MIAQTEALQDAVYALVGAGSTLYAARKSGLYRSRDEGLSWQNMFANLGMDDIPAAVAVVAFDQMVIAGVNGAVVRSEDGGDSWYVSPLGSPPPLVSSLAISPEFAQDGVVLASTAQDGVFLSLDRGVSWVPWNFGLIDLSVYALALSPNFAHDHVAFAGTESGIFRSSNGGRGWKETAFPMDAAPVLSLGMTQDGLVYAGTEAHGLYVSDDAGEQWKRVDAALLSSAIHGILTDNSLFVLLEDNLIISGDASTPWRSVDDAARFPATALTVMRHATDHGKAFVGFANGEIITISL